MHVFSNSKNFQTNYKKATAIAPMYSNPYCILFLPRLKQTDCFESEHMTSLEASPKIVIDEGSPPIRPLAIAEVHLGTAFAQKKNPTKTKSWAAGP